MEVLEKGVPAALAPCSARRAWDCTRISPTAPKAAAHLRQPERWARRCQLLRWFGRHDENAMCTFLTQHPGSVRGLRMGRIAKVHVVLSNWATQRFVRVGRPYRRICDEGCVNAHVQGTEMSTSQPSLFRRWCFQISRARDRTRLVFFPRSLLDFSKGHTLTALYCFFSLATSAGIFSASGMQRHRWIGSQVTQLHSLLARLHAATIAALAVRESRPLMLSEQIPPPQLSFPSLWLAGPWICCK